MQNFLYRLSLIRPGLLASGPTEEESRVIQAHFAYLQDLHATGTVLLAGRTDTKDEETFGIVVLQCEREVQAREIMQNDPAVRENIMEARLFPFRLALH